MACACKINQQITYLQKHYGTNQPQSKESNIRGMVGESTKKVLITLLLIPISPLMITYLIIRRLFSQKPISIGKFIKKK